MRHTDHRPASNDNIAAAVFNRNAAIVDFKPPTGAKTGASPLLSIAILFR
jgi:hypothetical protein